MAVINIGGERVVETTIKAKSDLNRVLYVSSSGLIHDLPPTNRPPLIKGLANDGQRILLDLEGTAGAQDVQPNVIGLTAQSVAALKEFV